MQTLFITGASGFIGRHLLRRLNFQEYKKIYCLSRSEKLNMPDRSEYPNVKFIKGGILEPATYRRYLADSDVVIHLAAATGKAKPEECFNVNVNGLEILIEECRQSRVKRVLYLSSIAVTYKDISYYYYAQSKLKAENVLKSSNLHYTIVRPTIVLGCESPIWQSFLSLGRLPLGLLFGGGEAKIQPIYIDDLIDHLMVILNEGIFSNETYDLGGPDVISVAEFIKILCRTFYQKAYRPFNIPLRYLIPLLVFLEKVIYPVLPITAGQITLFDNDGVTEKNALFNKYSRHMKKIDQMMALLKADQDEFELRNRLADECRAFCRYLGNGRATEYIINKYVDGNLATIVKMGKSYGCLDTVLIKTARVSFILSKLADAYTSVFFRYSVFRRKMVLMTAILECCPSGSPQFEISDELGKTHFYLRSCQKVSVFIFFLLISAVMFMPFHLIEIIQSSLSKH